MKKRTHASVTTIPCSCGYLQRMSKKPDLPIKFNSALSEYQIDYPTSRGGIGHLIIYHCPFCGGAAPESIRANLFTNIPGSEVVRLKKLVAECQTIEDVLTKLGKPDTDMNVPDDGIGHRQLIYKKLSKLAEVQITDNNGSIQISFLGKYLGPAGDPA
jgi:hypothetical protein